MQNPIRTRNIRSLSLVVIGGFTLAIIAGIALTPAAVPGVQMWHYDGMWNDGHMLGWGMWGWGMMLFGIVWMTFLIGVPLYLVYRLTNRAQPDRQSDDPALEVLREQYARGEIDDDEFERRRSRLS